MKQQTRFYVSRKNPLTWIAAALSLASIVLQILALCLGEGAVISTVNIWFQKVLPMAVSLGFALQLVLEGETRFYRTSKPIFWACVYFGQAALDLHLHGGYALFGYMRYVVMCWILYLLLYLIYRLTITGKIPVSYPLLFTLLVPLAILIYDLAMAGCTIPVWYRLVKISNIAMAGSAVVAVLAMRPFTDGAYHPTWGDRKDGRLIRTLSPMNIVAGYIMPTRNDACNSIQTTFEISKVERYIRQKRAEGMESFGLTHVLLAAYVRCIAKYPGVNRFFSGQRVYQRDDDVQFTMTIKKDMRTDGEETTIKLHLKPTDTTKEVYEKLNALIDEVKKLGNIILMIDEIHNIVGAGDAEGSMNAANILKPALSRGEIQVIGATTFNEYRKFIEKDSALERRFQPVTVAEPNMEDTLEILKGIAHYYENFHGVQIPEGILRQAVALSERYITDRFLPDKAIDLIDEACSDLNLHDASINRRMELKRDLENITFEREALMSAEPEEGKEFTQEELDARYARIAELRSQEMRLQEELTEIEKKGVPQLTMENVARVIELWTKIPASKIREEEFKRLSELEDRLKQHIVGQDEAVAAVAAAIRRNRVGISPKHKPVSFIFVGSTGVGKTELVKQLADDLFHAPESLIRLDMSEFMEKHSVSRIVGSPPGYVGYDEAGQLTEKIRRKPYSVVLFDEIEKAHPDVLNVLLQILDDGQITDAHGRKVNFENTVIVMTSNAGSDKSAGGTVGFGRSSDEQDKERVMKALQSFLRPEFINRVDEIVYFHQLTKENFAGIARIMLRELTESLSAKGFTFTYDDTLVAYLVDKSYSAAYGARNLRRCIQKELEDPMAVRIIESFDHPITHIRASASGEKVTLETL